MNTTPTTPTSTAVATTNSAVAKVDFTKQAGQDEDLSIDVKIETELCKSERVVLWLFITVLVILTVVAGCLFWSKISSTF